MTAALRLVYLALCLTVSVLARSADEVTIYGSVIAASQWASGCGPGLYSFSPAQGDVLTPIRMEVALSAQGGGVYANGYYYSIHAETNTLSVYDVDTWEKVSSVSGSSVALDLAYDATTDRIYGCFVDNGPQLGILHPADGSYERVATLSAPLHALVCTAEGQLYGISMNQWVRVDKATGGMEVLGTVAVMPSAAQSATIDPNTGKCYWASHQEDVTSILYEVSLADGQCTPLMTFSGHQEITGLFILPSVADEAPARVTDLKAEFPQGGLNGTVRFRMPEQTSGGAVLAGELTYRVQLNGEERTGKAQPGEQVSLDYTLPAGSHKLVVTALAGALEGERAALSFWVGLDTPKAVGGLTLEKTAPDRLSLRWTAPEGGAHGGYVDLSSVTYRVVRYPGHVTVAASTTETSWTETVTASSLNRYWYVVTPLVGSLEGEETASNKVVMGEGLPMPFEEAFDTQSGFELFTVYDVNQDGETWMQDLASETVGYAGLSASPADDWLVTPPLHLSAKDFYRVSLQVCCHSFLTHRLEVALGSLPGLASLSTTLMPAKDVKTEYGVQELEADFYVAQEADYYIGLHLLSEGLSSAFRVSRMKVTRIASTDAPAAPADLVVTPDPKGGLEATVSFVVPTTSINGGSLGTLAGIDVFRNDELLHQFVAPLTPGEVLQYKDTAPTLGYNVYRVVASNEAGSGEAAVCRAYVGVDVPGPVTDILLTEPTDGVVALSWKAPQQGMNGGYVDSKSLTYQVLRNGWYEVENDPKSLSLTDETVLAGTSSQKAAFYVIQAVSEAGMSETVSPYIMVGSPYEVPFVESFAKGRRPAKGEWLSLPDSGDTTWEIIESEREQDADAGMVSLTSISQSPMEASFLSPKVKMDNVVRPWLRFWLHHTAIDDQLELRLLDAQREAHLLTSIDLKQSVEGWTQVEVDLSAYVGQAFVQLEWRADGIVEGDELWIDNIRLTDDLEQNLWAKALSVPQRLFVDREETLALTVANLGSRSVADYMVDFYQGETLLASMPGQALEAGQEAVVSTSWAAQVPQLYEVELWAEVRYDADENPANNVSRRLTIPVVPPAYPTATGLEAMVTGTSVTLNWAAPVLDNLPPLPVVDDFEAFEPFTTTKMGDWTLIDVDKDDFTMEFQTASGEWITYPHSGYGMSFQVIDLTQVIATADDGWTAQSGHQFLICPYSAKNDNWLISPELYPVEQTVRISAKSLNFGNYGLENFTLLYSTTDTKRASFQELQTVSEVPTRWTEYAFRLPAEARYFAVRAKNINAALFLDDAIYIPASGTPLQLTLEGYRMYRDGRRVAELPASATSYADAEAEAEQTYLYAVTAVYDRGESDFASIRVTNSVSIETLRADACRVYGAEGCLWVKEAEGRAVRISGMDGRLCYDNPSCRDACIFLPAGIYLVEVEGADVRKVVVTK